MSKSELWTVSELAGEFDLTTQALRFYEEKGLLSPRRVGNSRVYDRRDRATRIGARGGATSRAPVRPRVSDFTM